VSIKRFGIAFAATVSGIALLASGVQLNEYWNAYSRARAAYNEEVLLTSGFGTAGGLTVERGPVNRALLGAGPASSDVLKEFDNNKGDTDAALSSLEHLAREVTPQLSSR
jgi:methyl-accepting chemotaxis protein